MEGREVLVGSKLFSWNYQTLAGIMHAGTRLSKEMEAIDMMTK